MIDNFLNNLRWKASNPKNSAWVFACAGSGKTKILIDRILRLLLEDVECSKILCVTFTNVASNEMQERIGDELANWVLYDDIQLRNCLYNLTGTLPNQELINKARSLFFKVTDSDNKIRIQTIHSFCQNLIKTFPFEAKVNPNFDLLDENQEKFLIKESQNNVLNLAKSDENLRKLIIEISSIISNDDMILLSSKLLKDKEIIYSLKEKFCGIEGLINKIYEIFLISKDDNEKNSFLEFIDDMDRNSIEILRKELSCSSSKNDQKIANQINNFLQNCCYENFEIYQFAFLKSESLEARKIYTKQSSSQEIFMQEVDRIIQYLDKINSIKLARQNHLIIKFIDQIMENYSLIKRQKSVLDYQDLISESNKLINNPDFSNWVKMKIDGGFDHILLDESQDTNYQQWNIIKAIVEDFFSGDGLSNQNRTIFVVGDEKQSIFSFQGADIESSRDAFDYLEKILGERLLKIDFNHSFRSSIKILELVDKVFSSQERQDAISKITKYQPHIPKRNDFGLVEIWPAVVSSKKEKQKDDVEWKLHFLEDSEEKEVSILAKNISDQIVKLKSSCDILESTKRPIQYGDIMILVRNKTNGLLRELTKKLSKEKIPFSSINKINFDDSILIQALLSLAKFSLFPKDDLSLAILLKSSFFQMKEENLLEFCIKKNQNNISLFEALDENGEIKNKLNYIIKISKNKNCTDFFCDIINSDCNREKILSFYGSQSLEILDQFILKIYEFSKKFSNNLQKFLEYVEITNPEINLISPNSDCVKITTVHSAKGLQSPIVIMADCCYDLKRTFANNKDFIFINHIPIWCSKKSEENFIVKKAKENQYKQLFEENLRLLYVAMTRAKDRLYITGFGKDDNKNSWYNIIKNL